MLWWWPLTCVVLAISTTPSLAQYSGSFVSSVRQFLLRWHPSRPLYVPSERDKNFMKQHFITEVGPAIVTSLKDKLIDFTMRGTGKSEEVEVACIRNKRVKCRKSVLDGIAVLNQESEYKVTDKVTHLETYMNIRLDSLKSTTDIVYITGTIGREIKGKFIYSPPPQEVKIQVILKRKWYLWFISSHCFVSLNVEYNQVTGDPNTSLQRDSALHATGGANTLDRHEDLEIMMTKHLKSAVAFAVTTAFTEALNDYTYMEYVCKRR